MSFGQDGDKMSNEDILRVRGRKAETKGEAEGEGECITRRPYLSLSLCPYACLDTF